MMHPRSFLARISAVLLIAIVFELGVADQQGHEIEFSPPRVHYDIGSAKLWRW